MAAGILMSRSVKIGIYVVTIFSLSSCAVSGNNDKSIMLSPWPLTKSSYSYATLLITSDSSNINTGSELQKDISRLEKITHSSYQDSALFTEINSNKNSNINVEINLTKKTSDGLGVYFFTELSRNSLFIIPCYIRESYVLHTTFKTDAGVFLGAITQNQHVTNVMHLLLFPAAIMRQPQKVEDKVLYELNRATLMQARQQGII